MDPLYDDPDPGISLGNRYRTDSDKVAKLSNKKLNTGIDYTSGYRYRFI
jgi:hypothetical protein